jgi:hypothetical protein
MIRALDSKIHHLAELAFVEKMLYGLFNPEKFYTDLADHMAISVDWETKDTVNFAETKKIDNFIENYFGSKIPEAEKWLIRAYCFGRIVSDSEVNLTVLQPINLVEDISTNIVKIGEKYNLGSAEVRALRYATEKAGMNITNTTLNTIKQAREAITRSIQTREGYRGAVRRLYDTMFKDVGELNRDWSRVAIYETNRAFADGFISRLSEDAWVIGLSMPDACPDCKIKIHNKIFKVTKEPGIDYSNLTGGVREQQEKKWEKYIWEGKENIGRSSSKKKRISDLQGNTKDNLRSREHHEQSMPTIPMHPNCRCRMTKFNPNLQYIDKNGELKFSFHNREEHKKFYEENIKGF